MLIPLDRDDTDGSESLTYVLANVPAGIIIEQDGQVITASDTLTSLVNITIRPEINVSGEFVFRSLPPPQKVIMVVLLIKLVRTLYSVSPPMQMCRY